MREKSALLTIQCNGSHCRCDTVEVVLCTAGITASLVWCHSEGDVWHREEVVARLSIKQPRDVGSRYSVDDTRKINVHVDFKVS